MGFNISGVIIKHNFEKDIQKVSEHLELGLELISECEPYQAVERIKEKDKVFICFTDTTTVIFYEPGQYDKNIYSQSYDTLNFQYLEGPMIFAIRYIRDCEIVRNIMSIDGKVIHSTGRKLKAETGTRGVDEIIVNLAEQIYGLRILGLSPERKVIACKLVAYTGKRIRKSEQEIHAMLTERRISREFDPDYDDVF